MKNITMNYKETLDYLFNSYPVFDKEGVSAYKPGLERVVQFNEYLDKPDSTFCAIHVAGTNGKGSVSHILAAVLQSAGYCVGLFTSPHLKDFRERIKVNGEMIDEKSVVNFVSNHKNKMEEFGMSFFEMNVGIAFDHFRKNNVEIAIIETGLGGRLDATNIITPILSIITNIGLDHISLLGDTLELIAAEKAGIIKKGVPVLIGERNAMTDQVFVDKATEVGATIFFTDQRYIVHASHIMENTQVFKMERMDGNFIIDIELDLMGEYQTRNVRTAFGAINMLNTYTNVTISRRAMRDGCRNVVATTGLKGRWQILNREPLTICDTGHNENGFREICAQIERQKFEKLYMVIGFVDDKDIQSILPLLPKDAHYIFTQAETKRAIPAELLSKMASSYGLAGVCVNSVQEAYKRANQLASEKDMIFIGGSTYVVAEL